MYLPRRIHALAFLFSLVFLLPNFAGAAAQAGASGLVTGVVTDTSGAVIPGATVTIQSTSTAYKKTATAGPDGTFKFSNLPYGIYRLTATQTGFETLVQDVSVQSPVAISKIMALQVAAATQTVTVEANSNDVLEKDVTAHTDIDRSLTDRLPLLSSSSGVSAAITLASPGVAADSDGMFHPLGEHADTTYAVDGQPISDQQSKTFSNQISMNAIQSLEVIAGVIPPEYGDKASLVARTTTRSGLGDVKPTGNLSINYGSFGTTSGAGSLGFGSAKLGNFVTLDATNSGRFLDTPEFVPLHARGNNESIFNRIDYAPSSVDTFHLNLTGSRSWFQVPNQYDQQALGQDQHSEILGFNIAPFWTRVFGQTGVLSVNPYLRQDNVHYYPSKDIFQDTPATLSQDRTLRNLGLKVDYSYAKGIHNAKFGGDINHTFLTENFGAGITSSTYNALCTNADGVPVTAEGVTMTSQCAAAGYLVNPNFQPALLKFDLTRGGAMLDFHGYTDIKEESLYAEDQITLKDWQFMVGVRGDNYNGLSSKYMAEPRVGATYNLTKTGTVLRGGYSRLMPTPYNENLILSSSTGNGGLSNELGAFGQNPLVPAARNQFDAGFQQAVGKYLIIDGEYFWKFTKDDFDFDVLFNTPLAFPIQWRKSKIDGFDLRVTMPVYRGISAYSVMGHSRSRFFGPERGGILFNNPNGLNSYAPFRIDHDQAFEQTTHFQYQPKPQGGWYGFTWRYDSGLVAGNVPFATDTTTPVNVAYLTANQQQQIQLTCAGVRATLTAPLTSCAPNELTAPLVRIPAPGTQDPDRNPARIAPRNLFDMSAGWDNVLHRDRFKTNASFTVTNLTNKVALFNFLSTFSGTHFVPPRAYTAALTLNF
ncbi:MAG TPA: TonB-dependent receptor [Silvibacterium sp.]|nr:TonB-dependent receptor [Silvibacterium sp.]